MTSDLAASPLAIIAIKARGTCYFEMIWYLVYWFYVTKVIINYLCIHGLAEVDYVWGNNCTNLGSGLYDEDNLTSGMEEEEKDNTFAHYDACVTFLWQTA